MDRRALLKTLPALAVGLAGCTGGQNTPEPTASPTAESTPESTATPTAESTGTSEPTDSATADGTPMDTADSTPTDSMPEPDVEVTVGPGGGLRFEPDDFTISAGDTVRWTWAAAGHNIKYDDGAIPSGSDWQGTPDSRTTTYGEGYTHTYTFTTTGRYEYYCVPHRNVGDGMTGAFTVE